MSGLIVQQYWELLYAVKTQTRRLKLPDGMHVGKSVAVVPKRGKHAWWLGEWRNRVMVVENPIIFVQEQIQKIPSNLEAQEFLTTRGFVQTRIEVAQLWIEPLCEISYFDARSEGVADKNAYMKLWNSINSAKGSTWRDNPEVFCIQFTRTAELAAMVAQMKTQKAKAA